MPGKGIKRKALSVGDKINILEEVDKNSHLTRIQISKNLNLPVTTLNGIVAKRNIILNSSEKYRKIKKFKKGKYEDVEEKLKIWLEQEKSKTPIRKAVLKKKAEEIAKKMKIDFVASNGWCDRVKKRLFLGEERGEVFRMQEAKANGTAVETSTSSENSVGHTCSCMLEKKSGNGCSALQRCGALLPCGSGEVITPDLETQASGETEMETQNGASTSLLNASNIIIKQEIIETEEEFIKLDDASFHPPFTSDSLDGQRPGTSYSTHSNSSNSNCSLLTSEPGHAGTISTFNQSVKVEPGVFSGSCGTNSEKNNALSIASSSFNVENSETCGVSSEKNCAFPSTSSSVNVENSENSARHESFQPGAPTPVANSTGFGDASNNEQIQLGVPFHVEPPPTLPQNSTYSNHGQVSNNDYNHPKGQSYSNPLFRRRDEFDTFGEFVAMKLRNLNPQLRVYVQSSFADLILRVESRAMANRDATKTTTDDSEKSTPLSDNPKEKENIQPIIPSIVENPNLPSHGSALRDDTIQQIVPCHIENTSLPPTVTNISYENSLRSGTVQPTVTSQFENQSHQVLNEAIPESLSRIDSNQITLSSTSTAGLSCINTAGNWTNAVVQPTQSTITSHVDNIHQLVSNLPGNSTNSPNQTSVSAQNVVSAVPRVLHPAYSSCTAPAQPIYSLNTRHNDEWDSYGQFVALKLRNLDQKSCLFVQTAFADLIFKAELGKFTNERIFFNNRTNAFQQNRFSSYVHRSQTNQLSNVPRFVTQPQGNFMPPHCFVGQVPMATVPNCTVFTNSS